MVFTEFIDMVEQRFSPELMDEVIEAAAPPNGGAYTAVGQYDHHELVKMVVELSARTGVAIPDLVRTFGEYLFGRFHQGYPHLFEGMGSAFQMLSSIESIIHPEVRKLYPDARPPHFDIGGDGVNTLEMTYRSDRHFGDLAEGLIRACIEHFDERIALAREDLVDAPGSVIRFVLTRQNA
ncbi:MAG: heme NO-binding domain-containing protein [Methyloversatilis discipulorum]|nr:heme NO-binding domain-containing protein [Methyloversatilis discipulorum]